jgi:transcriptional regulator with XRE-family HTH domain
MGVKLNPLRLRYELAIRGLRSADIAHVAGISTATMSAAMRGRPVSPRTLRKLAVALARVPPVPGSEDLLDLTG